MPWCEECSKFWNPTSLQGDGTCPSCGHTVATAAAGEKKKDAGPKAPWHFKLMIAAVALYLGWRLVEAVGWLIEAIT